jgi:hypothetical protein
MRLRIRYRSSDDQVSERVIPDIEVDPPNRIYAHCELRGEQRTFALDRIEEAVDLEAGELVSDIWTHVGLPACHITRTAMFMATVPQNAATNSGFAVL